MEEQNAQNQTQPVVTPASQKKSYVWLWVIGGCLMIIILIFGAILAVGWWGAKKIKENQPRIEQWQKEAEEMQKNAEKFQEEMNKIQNNIPSQIPADDPTSVPETDKNSSSL